MDSPATKQDIEQLTQKIEEGFENLAGMVQRGFLSIEGRLKKIEERLAEHDRSFESIATILERIELRLSQVAYDIDIKELQKRVERLEEHAGLKK